MRSLRISIPNNKRDFGQLGRVYRWTIPGEECWQAVRKAGFVEIQVVARHILTSEELEAMARCQGEEFTPPPSEENRIVIVGKVASVKFTAMRPAPN